MSSDLAIIIPAFNARATIERAIESVLTQVDPSLQIEIVVVDDGSTDETATIVEALAGSRSNIHLLRANHGGVSRARNVGLDYALLELTTKFIGFVDSDDYVSPRFYSDMTTSLTVSGCDAVSLSNPQYAVSALPQPMYEQPDESHCYAERNDIYCRELLHLRRPTSVWAYLFRASCFGDQRFDPEITVFEDLDYLLRLLPRVGAVARSASLGYNYEIQESSVNRKPMGNGWLTSLAVYYSARRIYPKADVDAFGCYLVRLLLLHTSSSPPREWKSYAAPIRRLARDVSPTAIRSGGSPGERLMLVMAAVSPQLIMAAAMLVRNVRMEWGKWR